MKHSIREHIIDPIRGKIVKVSTINAELGSGITDKNGKEIFEGDRVKHKDEFYKVVFSGGHFGLENDMQDWIDLDLVERKAEVVGHAED